MRMIWHLLMCTGLPVCAACTTVTVRNAEVTERRFPGLTVLEITPHSNSTSIVNTRGLGLVLATRSATLGYLDETLMLTDAPNGCRIVIVVRSADDVAALRTVIRDGPLSGQICLLNKETAP